MRAFSLIEVLLYIAVFSMTSISLVTSTIQLTRTAARDQTRAQVLQEAAFITSKIRYYLSDASHLSYESSTTILFTPAGTTTTNTLTFASSSLLFGAADEPLQALTDTSIAILNGTFEISSSTNILMVHAEFSAQDVTGEKILHMMVASIPLSTSYAP